MHLPPIRPEGVAQIADSDSLPFDAAAARSFGRPLEAIDAGVGSRSVTGFGAPRSD